MEMMNHHHHQNQHQSYQAKRIQNWEEQVLRHQASMKQESSNNNSYGIMSSPNSPPNKSCATIINTNEDNNNNIHSGLNLSEVGQNSELFRSRYNLYQILINISIFFLYQWIYLNFVSVYVCSWSVIAQRWLGLLLLIRNQNFKFLHHNQLSR